MALVGFFWCLLVTAARADRRDTHAARSTALDGAAAAQRTMGRFARARGRLRRSAREALNVRPETDQVLRQHEKPKR